MKQKIIRSGLYLALISIPAIGGFSGCAVHENASLQRAQMEIQNAQQNQQLVANAPTVLKEAAVAYDRADREWKTNHDFNETEHLVYVTEQTLQIAREESRRKMAHNFAQLDRDTARIAAGSLRADRDSAHARADMQGLISEQYRQESLDHRELISALNHQVSALKARETTRGLELTLAENVFFGTNSSDLKAGAVLKLGPLTSYLKNYPERLIMIEGHTDSRGSDAENRELSQMRANAVRDLLISQGVDSYRIMAKGLGEDYPITTNNSESGRLQNRRVQIILSQPKN